MSPARRAFALWAALTVAGAVLVALPDDDRRIVSFSPGHGPAALDLAGILLLSAGMVAYVAGLSMARSALRRRDLAWAAAAYVPALLVVAWSIASDAGLWWAAAAALALATQAWLAWRTTCGATLRS